ncbi:MAG: winged helix-turn-helix domain-containing protein, partial [Candidatus Sulfotelmatobacter sp.]
MLTSTWRRESLGSVGTARFRRLLATHFPVTRQTLLVQCLSETTDRTAYGRAWGRARLSSGFSMAGDAQIRQIRRFGIFEVDLQRRELFRNGVRVKLRDQAFLLLTTLIEQPGDLVTREQLRNKLWPDGTFVDFDGSLNAAIKRLRDALDDDPDNPRFIETVPKRGYRFLAPVDDPSIKQTETTATARTLVPRSRLPLLAGVVLLSVIVVGFGAKRYVSRSGMALARPPFRVVPLTTYPGAESGPTFSGDGEQVAFVWDGDTSSTTDIYVKRIGIDPPLKLTRTDGLTCCPSWTSDNKYVAFERCSHGKQGIYLVPSLGGPERKLRDTDCNGISFSPKDQSLVFSERVSSGSPYRLFSMALDDLQPHPLTSPPADAIGDFSPVYSPDGTTVAFIRLVAEGNGDLYLVSASGGIARQVTSDKAYIYGVAWSADGKDLVFSSHRDGSQSLWFVSTVGAIPKRLPLGGAISTEPAISRQGNR